MARRLPQTTFDYMIVAISPVLIMFLVGSLAFFLIEVAYSGEFVSRLRFVVALFVMAATLCCRISIEEGVEYAQLFAIPLALVTLMALMKFVDAGIFINMMLIGVVWFSAYKLTWDCTVIDESQTAKGNGLLETVGLDPPKSGENLQADEAEELESGNGLDEAAEAAATTGSDENESFWKWITKKAKRHHAPGIWVVYFALASLPLFGLGQIVLSERGRSEGFRLLVIYVASALGLLMTTSLLQLRRYVRQRKIQMSDQMASSWLITGTVLLLGVLTVCMLLPLPSPDYSLTGLARKFLSPEDLKSSSHSVGDEGVRDGEKGSGKSKEDSSDTPSDSDGRQSSDQAESEKTGDDQSGSNESESGQQSDSNGSQSNDNRSSENQSNDGQQNSDQNSEDSQSSDSSQANNDDQAESQQSDSEQNQNGESDQPSENQQAESDQVKPQETQSSSQPQSAPQTNLLQSLGSIAKMIYWLGFALLVLFLAWKYRRQIMAALSKFIQDIRDLLARLFGRKPKKAKSSPEDKPKETGPPLPSFAAFQNPFASGAAQTWPLEQLVRYTFEALEAWARENDCARDPDQTPVEFAEQIGRSNESVGQPAHALAGLYNRVAYAKESPARSSVDAIKRLWSKLR